MYGELLHRGRMDETYGIPPDWTHPSGMLSFHSAELAEAQPDQTPILFRYYISFTNILAYQRGRKKILLYGSEGRTGLFDLWNRIY